MARRKKKGFSLQKSQNGAEYRKGLASKLPFYFMLRPIYLPRGRKNDAFLFNDQVSFSATEKGKRMRIG